MGHPGLHDEVDNSSHKPFDRIKPDLCQQKSNFEITGATPMSDSDGPGSSLSQHLWADAPRAEVTAETYFRLGGSRTKGLCSGPGSGLHPSLCWLSSL